MDTMKNSPEYMLERLKRVPALRDSELFQVTTFHAHRTRKDGILQEVTIEILDAGESADPRYRFQCNARGDDGRSATGNPEATVDTVISVVHWAELDRDS
jgi:hypothetical protein